MALNFTVSYTFSPSTTISSSQVNTNTNDVAAVFQGLEAETKTLAKLKVDIDPTLALEVATKQYVDHYSTYRRPVLQYSSSTVVNMQTGINGTSGQAQILFPDGNLRTDSTSGRINCNLAQVAALSGSWQSGLRTGSVAVNTWYAIYAVKTTDDTAKFVAVADTVLPIQANYSTLNSNFGTNGWVYLGLVSNGNGLSSNSAIVTFKQAGNMTVFNNTFVGNAFSEPGKRMATTAGAASTVTYTYSAGTGATNIPDNITHVLWGCYLSRSGAHAGIITTQATGQALALGGGATSIGNFIYGTQVWGVATDGLVVSTEDSSNTFIDGNVVGWIDGVLGVGANPLL